LAVGFTTSEIRYDWVYGPGAVSIFPEVQMPQFQVMGYRKRSYEYALTTGQSPFQSPPNVMEPVERNPTENCNETRAKATEAA